MLLALGAFRSLRISPFLEEEGPEEERSALPFPLSEVAARREDDERCADEELEAVMRARGAGSTRMRTVSSSDGAGVSLEESPSDG